ncbi:GNAT family N-acetyltransferase [Chitinophaga sp. 22321]|uniref:GNAT family N-acetyltransferase n=1 Tax=Chitinophaga hostae TaxID=2831022 RepID=A0ABS5J1I2_9BACT|nr:GNAT family N-acetyltransferase [Chitinophaga hostae]MBS0029010.1 GNAT family N-acetyltransferase [Chitinophaga hostae]
MENIKIRKAVVTDLPVLLTFEQGIIAAERPYDNRLKEGTIHYYDIAAMIAATHIEVLVAESDGVIIGSGYARIQDAKPYLKISQYAYLGFMYVVPSHRGKGVNKLVMAGLKAWAMEQGIAELRLDVYAGNEAAIKAYEKAGFAKNLIEMRLPL